MAGRVNWEANVSSNVREVLECTDKLRGELEKLENGNYGIKLNIDEKRLASVISNLDKMLSSLGKGSGDFKQFENLSKELSGIISEVQNLFLVLSLSFLFSLIIISYSFHIIHPQVYSKGENNKQEY